MRLSIILMFLLQAIISYAAEMSHVFVVEGSGHYSGTAPTTVVEGYFLSKTYAVNDAFTLKFDNGFSTKTASVVEDKANGNWGKIYQRHGFKITPAAGKAVKGVRVATVNDMTTGGFATSDGTPLGKTGANYVWSGNATSMLHIAVASDDANDYLGFYYIEVTYDSAVSIGEPDDPDIPDNPDNPDTPDNPDKPEQISPVTIWPKGPMIAPYDRISFGCNTEGVKIHYTTDGTRPNGNSRRYTAPFALSIASGMTVRAMAVAPDGQTSEASRQFYFDEVASVSDFFANGAAPEPVTITGDFQLVMKSGDDAYFLDLNSDRHDYVYCDGGLTYLSRVKPGDIVSSLRAVASADGMMDVAALASAPRTVSSDILPEPEKVSVRNVSEKLVHHYIAVDGRITGQMIDDGNYSLAIDERYFTVMPSDCGRDITAIGFLALDSRGRTTLRLTDVERRGEPDTPDTPGNPDEKAVSMSSAAIGAGRVEIFPGLNSYTKTPEGAPFAAQTTVLTGDIVYVFFLPDAGYELAGIVLNTTPIDPKSHELADTPYGKMLAIEVKGPVSVIATFAAASGVEGVEADGAAAEYFDLAGRRLGRTRPTAPGTYVERRGASSSLIIINRR